VALALLLALLSWPLVVLTFDAVDTSRGSTFYRGTVAPASEVAQWTAGASAVFVSALVAATIGAPIVKRRARMGAALTFLVALLVAVPALPLLPAVLGQHVGAGCFFIGSDPCTYLTTTDDLFSGLRADAGFCLAPLIDPLPVLILGFGVAVWAYLVRRWGEPMPRPGC
jgi:hypothetical protein